MPSQRLFTQEAAGYLIPLLDKERDAAEIADLRAKQADIAGRATGDHADRHSADR